MSGTDRGTQASLDENQIAFLDAFCRSQDTAAERPTNRPVNIARQNDEPNEGRMMPERLRDIEAREQLEVQLGQAYVGWAKGAGEERQRVSPCGQFYLGNLDDDDEDEEIDVVNNSDEESNRNQPGAARLRYRAVRENRVPILHSRRPNVNQHNEDGEIDVINISDAENVVQMEQDIENNTQGVAREFSGNMATAATPQSSRSNNVEPMDSIATQLLSKQKLIEALAKMNINLEALREAPHELITVKDLQEILKSSCQPRERPKSSVSNFPEVPFSVLYPELKGSDIKDVPTKRIQRRRIPVPNRQEESRKFMQRRISTDTIVTIGTNEARCHFMVLTFYSDAFYKWGANMKNVSVKRFTLDANLCSYQMFEKIYTWMIMDSPTYRFFETDEVLEVFIAVNYLEILSLIRLCYSIFESEKIIDEKRAVKFYYEARKRNIQYVKDRMVPKISKIFIYLAASPFWKQLTLDEIKAILTSDNIMVGSEMDVLGVGIEWIKQDWDNRWPIHMEIIKCVRFKLLTPPNFTELLEPTHPTLAYICSQPNVKELIENSSCDVAAEIWSKTHNSESYSNATFLLPQQQPRKWYRGEPETRSYNEFIQMFEELKEKLHDSETPVSCLMNIF